MELALAVSLCVMLLVGTRTAYAAEVASGEGWTLDDSGVFTFTGDVADLTNSSVGKYPRAEYTDQIRDVVVAEGVTRVPQLAFDCNE